MAVNSFNAQNPPVTTKGDVFTFSTIPTRLGVGANDTVLTADSTAATGLKWAAAGGSYASYTLLNAGGTALTGSGTITISGIANYERFIVLVQDASSATAGVNINLRINADSGANQYDWAGGIIYGSSTYSTGVFDRTIGTSSSFSLGGMSSNAASTVSAGIFIDGGRSTGTKSIRVTSGATAAGGSSHAPYFSTGIYKGTATISSISVVTGAGNFDNGTIYVYGSAN